MSKHKYGFIGTERERNSNVLKKGSDEEIAQFIADIVNESVHFAYNYYTFDRDHILKVIADKLSLLVSEDGLDFNNNKFHEMLRKRRKFYTKRTAKRYCTSLGMYYPITKEKIEARYGKVQGEPK